MTRRQISWLVLALGYSGLIVFLSSLTNLSPPNIGVQLNDKLLHLIEYAGFGFLWGQVFLSSGGLSVFIRWLILFGGGVLFAVLDEVHQAFVPGREADVLDGAADMVGIVLGLYLSARISGNGLRKRKKG